MKKFFSIMVCSVLLMAASLAHGSGIKAKAIKVGATAQNNAIAFSWTYSAQSGVAACPTTGTPTTCVSGFTITDTTAGTTVATPSTINSTTTSYTYTPSAGLYFGTHTFSIVVNGFDNNGNALTSAAVTTTVSNNLTTLNPVTGFTGVAN